MGARLAATARVAAGDQPRTLGWSRSQSQVPSGWRRATSTVALPDRVVEVRAMSSARMAGRTVDSLGRAHVRCQLRSSY
jgi:hypothetical protein